MKVDDCMKEEYESFLRYIKCTWGSLLDKDWVNEPKIDEIIIDLYKNEFTVLVKLKSNSYYRFKDGKLITEKYDTNQYIKTTYDINDSILMHMMFKTKIFDDLDSNFGLNDAKVFINPIWIEHLPIHQYLSKELESEEESYAETLYCIMHDL